MNHDWWMEQFLNDPASRTTQELKEACWYGSKRIAVLETRVEGLRQKVWLAFICGMGVGAFCFLLGAWLGGDL